MATPNITVSTTEISRQVEGVYGSIACVATGTEQTNVTPAAKINQFDTNGLSNDTTPDHTSDDITVDIAGTYLVSATLSFVSNTATSRTWEGWIYRNTTPQTHLSFTRTVANTQAGDVTISGLLTLAANDTVSIRVLCSTTPNGFILEKGNLAITRIGA